MSKRSRLLKKAQKRSTQTLILSLVGIVLILFIFLRYGIPFLSDFSFFASNALSTGDSKDKKNEDKNIFISAPRLDSIPKATNQKNLKITGTSLAGLSVQIYLNGNREEEKEVEADGSFEFEINLTEGENIIKVRAAKGEKTSDFSDSKFVNFKNKPPELTIESPNEGANISGQNPHEIKGKTDDPDNKILINDFQAITKADGSWVYMATYKGGENELKIVAIDAAGNKTEKTLKINYSL